MVPLLSGTGGRVLTVDFDRFPVKPGELVLDLGCGAGRHAFALYRRGAHVVALDMNAEQLKDVSGMFFAMAASGEVDPSASGEVVRGNAYALPFPDASFDKIIAAEVLEHLSQDTRAIAELTRVLKPGGLIAITVPRWLPEKICWALSAEYHEVEGGHVRIYKGNKLRARLTATGLQSLGAHHAHALHSPYWWLKCTVGVSKNDHPVVSRYHSILVWHMMKAPAVTRVTERALNPLIGKSLVIYLRKPEVEYAPR